MSLDDAYANAPYIPGADSYPPRWAKEAAALRAALGARAQVGASYGDSPRQVFDFFHPEGLPKGTVIFVHGGYWMKFDASSFSHLAAGALARGWAVAMPSYDLCPDASITQIGSQIAAAITAIAGRTQGTISLAGHSAGGQLVARVMDPLLLTAEVRDRIGQVVSISPVADLEPLLQTSMNETLGLDAEEVQRESPVHMSPPHGVNVTIWVGAEERPAFLEQADVFSKAWGAKLFVLEDTHHFDVIEPLADRESEMVTTLLGAK